MAHLITNDDHFVERDNQVSGRAWHGLGTVVPADYDGTVWEMFQRAGADLQISKVPEYGNIATAVASKTPRMVKTGRYLLYRHEQTFNGQTLDGGFVEGAAPVSEDYHVIDNRTIADLLEPLNKEWPIETVGVLKNGSVIFAALAGGKFSIAGKDEHDLFFLVSDGKNGLQSMRVDVTPVRVVCDNTLRMGIAAASLSVKIEHTRQAGAELSFWAEAIPQMTKAAEQVRETLEMLAATPASPAMVEEVIASAFPLPVESGISAAGRDDTLSLSEQAKLLAVAARSQNEYHVKRIRGFQDMAHEQYELHNEQHPETAGTLFGAAQSANWVAVHRKGHAGSLAESVTFGSRAGESKRAFGTATKLALQAIGKGSRAAELVTV